MLDARPDLPSSLYSLNVDPCAEHEAYCHIIVPDDVDNGEIV